MSDRKQFLTRLAKQAPSRLEQALALLWFYEQTQQYDERTVADLVKDIADEGFGSQNITRLKNSLSRNRATVRGSRTGAFRINASVFPDLTQKYGPLIDVVEVRATSSVIPFDYVLGSRTYLERLVNQINGCYDSGFFDASAIILRRLAESLIIEIYIKEGRSSEIKNNNIFLQLNPLVSFLANDTNIHTSRNLIKGINLIKDIGDTAAHDRTYITPLQDIDDNKVSIRRTINELLALAGIKS